MKTITLIFLVIFPVIFLEATSPGNNFSLVQSVDLGNLNTASVQDIWIGSDLDGDNMGEIIIQMGLSSDASVCIYEYNGSSYSQIWSKSLPYPNTSSDNPMRLLSVIDSDNDGYPELFVGNNAGSGTYGVYCFEMAEGQLSSTNPSTTSLGPDVSGELRFFNSSNPITGLVTGDADNDGYGELYVCHKTNSSSLEIWEASGNDTWTKIKTMAVGDGITDIFPLTNLRGSGSSDLPLCEEHGKLTVLNCSDPANPTSLTVQNNVDKGVNIEGKITIFNLDNQGNPEIILGNSSDSSLYIFEWDASNSRFDRDKTDAPLLSLGTWILSLDAQDCDADGKGEIYYTKDNDVIFREFNSISGDFDSESDFSAVQTLVSGCDKSTNVVRISQNSGNSLLDGDNFRDIAVGTHGSGISGHEELVILESSVGDNSLPVCLSFFKAIPLKEGICLQWRTESEMNNQGFIIYRSINGSTFEIITSFRDEPSLTGTNLSESHEYQWIDYQVKTGEHYVYVLAEMNYSGEETRFYDYKQKVDFGSINGTKIQVYPNPGNLFMTIQVPEGISSGELQILDIAGKTVRQFSSINSTYGSSTILWDGHDEFGEEAPSGIYFITLRSERIFIKQKILYIK